MKKPKLNKNTLSRLPAKASHIRLQKATRGELYDRKDAANHDMARKHISNFQTHAGLSIFLDPKFSMAEGNEIT